ncbi:MULTISPECIES: GNAT family N-acetyltransferase [unclassified Fusibacter]|uniref:GNAT family N-acetyltransferase n=1 Tax=unclassified Fusibacter TaxID=2624464 RepID=UPI0010106571|nr:MULTISPECIES: GNAT family N-acetyltransferase [unclassified Fusibacter]MCK8061665.1 acetyltransferase [Fusibacter sp. A2]NPE23849.1 GNAT family N-acetyltransferase [Fusibacter sp. A1]RXV58564.1 GNAT family N-acetyltransferase [Fusibacter sp. A1]
MYTFTALQESDYYLLYNWLNEPHIIDYYTHQKLNMEALIERYGLWLSGEIPKQAFIIHENEVPMGLVTYYQLDDFEDYQFEVDLENAVGIEVIIGKEGYYYKGKLPMIIDAFVKEKELSSKILFAACALDNSPAIKAFKKAGFKFHKEVFNVLVRDMEQIFIKEV